MDILFGIAVVGVWIAISVVGLKRAYGAGGPSPQKKQSEADVASAPGRPSLQCPVLRSEPRAATVQHR